MTIDFSNATSKMDKLIETNTSFDKAVLKVAYTGQNRNGSHISKEAFELSIDTIYNCPIVCNYDRDTDTMGSHDVDVVIGKDGKAKLINLTQPVGVIPESANYWWETIEDESGEHEYLCVDVLLWKRQEAYSKIKSDGVTKESMEITVVDGGVVDGIYYVNRFEFTAFCLLGVEPCFESAAIHTFSYQDAYDRMMSDFKASYSMKGGDAVEKKNKLLLDKGIDFEKLGMSQEEFEAISYEEFKIKIEAFEEDTDEPEDGADNGDSEGAEENEPEAENLDDDNPDEDDPEKDPEPNEQDDDDDDAKKTGNNYALVAQFVETLREALWAEKISDDWGEHPRYYYVDCDMELNEVYCHDCEDWKLYGFTFETNGDAVTINWNSKTRKKFAIVDFVGEETETFSLSELINEVHGNAMKIQEGIYSEKIANLENEVRELQNFKDTTLSNKRDVELEGLWDKFSQLNDTPEYEELKMNCKDMEIKDIENCCYAILGKMAVNKSFSMELGKKTNNTKQKVAHSDTNKKEPYGGVFVKYGYDAR